MQLQSCSRRNTGKATASTGGERSAGEGRPVKVPPTLLPVSAEATPSKLVAASCRNSHFAEGEPRQTAGCFPPALPPANPHVSKNTCWLRATMGAEARRSWLPASTAWAAASSKIQTLGPPGGEKNPPRESQSSGSHEAPLLEAQQA